MFRSGHKRGGNTPKIRVVVALAGCAFMLALVLWKVDLQQVPGLIAGIAPGWLWAMVAAKLGAGLLKALRWQVVLRAATSKPPRRAFQTMFIGYFANVALPARLGEVIRVGLYRRHNEVSVGEVVGTVAVGRLFDALVLLAMLIASTALLPLPDWADERLLPIAAVTILAFVLIIGLTLVPRSRESALAGRVGRTIRSVYVSVRRGLGVVRDPRTFGLAAALTAGAWAAESLGTWLLLSAFGLSLPWLLALQLVSVSTLGVSPWGTMAGLGPKQLLYVAMLAPFGVDAAVGAVAASTGVVVVGAAFSLVGIVLLGLEGWSPAVWRRLATESDEGSASRS